MDNLAASFAFGIGGDGFGSLDFQTSLANNGDASLHTGLGTYSAFSTAAPGDVLLSQGNSMVSHSSGVSLQHFPSASYAQSPQTSSTNFNSFMSPRPAFSTVGLPAISTFGELCSQRMSGSRGFGLLDNSTESLAPVMEIGDASAQSNTQSTTIVSPSMPVFPTTVSPLMQTSIVAGGVNTTAVRADDNTKEAACQSESDREPDTVIGSGQTQSLAQSDLRSRFFYQDRDVSLSHVSRDSLPDQDTRTGESHGSICSNPPSGSADRDGVRCAAVTPMQRTRQSSRRAAAMAAQAERVSATGIGSKQTDSPAQSAGLGSAGRRDNRYARGGFAHNSSDTKSNSESHMQKFGTETGGLNTNVQNIETAPSAVFPRRTVVPFFKAGRFSLREPDMYSCQSRKVPQVTECVQTGHDVPCKLLPKPQKSLFPVNPKFADINPGDGKGGFPIPAPADGVQGRTSSARKMVIHSSRGIKPYTEGEGYAKRGHSKTVVSPSFGESAARAVMTTSVSDRATVVTVAIMSRQKSVLKPGGVGLLESQGSCRSKDDCANSVQCGASVSGFRQMFTEEEDSSGCNSVPEAKHMHVDSHVDVDSGSAVPVANTLGHSLRRRSGFDNVSLELESKDDFDRLMEERKEKARAAEQERMEISIRIDDSQCVTYGEQKRWQCDKCDKSYTTKHNLVMHMLDHSGIKPHLCLVCGKYFKQLSHLNTHMLTHDKVRPHTCPVCGKGFTQISHLKRHQTVHQQSKPYACDECGRGFCFPSELRLHKERHQQGIAQGEHACAQCGEEFSSAAQLKQHMSIHENQGDLSCRFCHRVFRYPSQLKDHVVVHSGSRPYMCTECGMDFMKEHHLRAHQFTHTGLRPYSCSECGRAFNQRANMLRHKLIHKAERSYKCDYCEKTFTQPQTLKAHMVVHADHKPYKCNQCGKEFGRLHNLHGHMHMHSDSKPYICFCGSSFTLKGNLNRHKKVKHGLNESTESMEEDAVHFLSSWSERTREERSGEDTMDDMDLSSLDADSSSADRANNRKQRKSTPRKIPRRMAGGRRHGSREGGLREEEEWEEQTGLFSASQGLYDGDVAVDTSCDEQASAKEEIEVKQNGEIPWGESGQAVRYERLRARRCELLARHREFIASLSDSNDGEDQDEGDPDEKDDDPSSEKHGKSAKLDSLIAEKFKSF